LCPGAEIKVVDVLGGTVVIVPGHDRLHGVIASRGHDELGAIAEAHDVVLAHVIGLPQVDPRALDHIAAGVVNLS
jgi:hypothetical protein